MRHTPESDAEIVRRRGAGEPYSKIAAAIGLPKNAVTGRGRRIGAAKTNRNNGNGRKPYVSPERKGQEFPPLGHCRFSTDSKTPYRWCGLPTGDIEMPWCPEHARIVYTVLPKKEEA